MKVENGLFVENANMGKVLTKRKIFIILIYFFLFEGCFTAALYTKDHNVRNYQNNSTSYLQSSPKEIVSIYRNKNFYILNWVSRIYSISDFKDIELEKKQNCIEIDLIETYRQIYFTQDLKQYSCQPDLDMKNSESIPFEEVVALRNKLWFKELNLAIDLKTEFDISQNPFSPPDQFCENADFGTCKRKIRSIINKQKLVSVYRTVDKFEDYIWLVFDSARILKLYRSYHGYKVVTTNNQPKWIDITEFNKIPESKRKKINFIEIPELEYGYFLGTISNEKILVSKVYKLKTKESKIRPGLILVGNERSTDKKIEKTSWTLYPILYPVSIGLDIATSPLQVVSILILGLYEHLWLGNCILRVSCKTPLG